MLKHVLDKGQFQYKADKSILPNFNQQFQLLMNMKGDSPICINCFPLVWSQIIFRYRIKIKDQLPDEIKKRSSCWYGINCSTATHNEDHQKKLDHVCAVSYTHLTLPTKRIVQISVVAVSLNKNTNK
eukprot:TRINITY_DN23315_c0_g1_i1.p1 TRINITY_DN23315_c0_g1~~TRINITY_DN23315_c0_g1_i1.p1  ORF type:complete len:127 (-),score=14.67 TRINITY_DN23315_c0_g1_i1:21-401(-)